MALVYHPTTRKIYVADQYNHRIQILNPDLMYSYSFGSYGSDNGQFQFPLDVGFDSTGNVYVADSTITFKHSQQKDSFCESLVSKTMAMEN